MFLPLFCAWVRKLAFGKSQDGEGGVLLGKWICAPDNAGCLSSLVGQDTRVLGCEPRRTRGMNELVREDAGTEKSG